MHLILLIALVFLPQTQTHRAPLTATFITATEGFLDQAEATDIHAPDAEFDPKFQALKTAKDNLKSMAEEDGEQEVVEAANNLLFAISACHLQSKNDADTTKCEAIIKRARFRVMAAIDKHKTGNIWADGPPA